MVINNKKVLEKVKFLFTKYAPLYKFLLGYAWACFVIEENIMKTKSTNNQRHIFDIHTANQLPNSFPFTYDDITQNPYLSIFVDQKVLNPKNNVMSLYCIKDYNGYGVCTFDEFKWRFNLFTSGDPNKDIFDGIDWNYFAISGSVIPACLQKKSPLFDCVVGPNQREEEKWGTFFTHYYGESDIDMMCNDMSVFGFTDKTNQVVEQIKKNLPDYKEGDIEVEPIKSMLIAMTKQFFTERVSHYNEHFGTNFTADELVGQLKSGEMKEYLYLIYMEHKSKYNSIIRKSGKGSNMYIKKFMEPSGINDMNIQLVSYEVTKDAQKNLMDSEIYFYVNDFRDKDNKVPDAENYMILKIGENIKFKIRSKKMPRSIELFRSKSRDFFGVVGRFHFPCVRAYYQGNNVYMMPSCITAMMTGINIDYKYFAGVRDPIDIINKYRMRGFGVLLTENEKKHMTYYNSHIKTFGGMFHIDGENKDDVLKMFTPKEINDKLYHPLVYTMGLSEDNYNKPTHTYIKTMSDLKEYYKTKYNYNSDEFGFDLFKFKTINEYGSITPLPTWLSKAYMDMKNIQETPIQRKVNDITVNDKFKKQFSNKKVIIKKKNTSKPFKPVIKD